VTHAAPPRGATSPHRPAAEINPPPGGREGPGPAGFAEDPAGVGRERLDEGLQLLLGAVVEPGRADGARGGLQGRRDVRGRSREHGAEEAHLADPPRRTAIRLDVRDGLGEVSDDGVKNPFDAMQRPYIDPDYSPAPGYTEQEWATLVVTARDHHRASAYRNSALAGCSLWPKLFCCCS